MHVLRAINHLQTNKLLNFLAILTFESHKAGVSLHLEGDPMREESSFATLRICDLIKLLTEYLCFEMCGVGAHTRVPHSTERESIPDCMLLPSNMDRIIETVVIKHLATLEYTIVSRVITGDTTLYRRTQCLCQCIYLSKRSMTLHIENGNGYNQDENLLILS